MCICSFCGIASPLLSRAIDLARDSRITEAVLRASSTSALDSVHISPLTEAHRLYSQASRAFFPERDMVLAPLHTRLIAIASSFKQEQLGKLQRVADNHASGDVAAGALSASCPALQRGSKSRLRKPINKALKRRVVLNCCPRCLVHRLIFPAFARHSAVRPRLLSAQLWQHGDTSLLSDLLRPTF